MEAVATDQETAAMTVLEAVPSQVSPYWPSSKSPLEPQLPSLRYLTLSTLATEFEPAQAAKASGILLMQDDRHHVCAVFSRSAMSCDGPASCFLIFARHGAWNKTPDHAPLAVPTAITIQSRITAVPKIVPKTRKNREGSSSPIRMVLHE
jgi:hypothetical protein